ncbi:ATP-dependent helicase [Cetobacterium sp. 2A]|uniref:ATP-dependent DNA helicase n=1 Tax=Cetobacterium sp. 2A TaxID=2754723 RepID=UPI00163BDD77|nr:ATP-dependent DNA helicase [Cetobacterium sp. 2A]MBC2856437.1 ATP-dependent helicase [Cetobacterium sp. 2A]
MGLSLLNENQKKAATTVFGPLLIIAGPGSGKTRTLVERVVYMIKELNIHPKNIMITTFTERAAKELITRVSNRLIGTDINISEMYIGTIHSICLKIIEENMQKSIMSKGFTVLENIEQKFFIFSKFNEFKKVDGFEDFFEGKYFPTSWKKSGNLQKWFNRISEEGIDLSKFLKNKKTAFLAQGYIKYRELLKQENTLDFSTIQLEAYRILKENPIILENTREKIKFIMVDEYQDTNSIQEKIIFLIGENHKNICVVGDDDQGIYRFRGATIKNILEFSKKFNNSECEIVTLNTNYRSESGIVDFCNKWIDSLNWEGYRHSKKIEATESKQSKNISVVKLSVKNSEREWAERIYRFIVYMKRIGKIDDYNQIAFLFRSVRDKRIVSLIHYLESKGISVYSPRSNLFFYREEIIKVIGILLYVFPRVDSTVFKEGVKSETLDYYKYCLKKIEKELLQDDEFKVWLESKKASYENIVDNGESVLDLFYELISLNTLKLHLKEEGIEILSERSSYNLGIFSQILEKFEKLCGISELNNENIDKVVGYLFNMHLKFLKEGGIDEFEDEKDFTPKGAVSFLTIHQSKGLEFPIVIVGSLDSVPDRKEMETEKDIEKIFYWEQPYEPDYRIKEFDFWRLFYTAFSRAQNLLVLSCVEMNSSKKEVPSLPFKRIYDDIVDISQEDFQMKNLFVDDVKIANVKDKYSFTSHILNYKQCPFRYKMNKIFKFQGKNGKDTFFGTLVHQTIENINKDVIFSKKIDIDIFKIEEWYYENYEILKKNERITLDEESLKLGLNQVLDYFKNGKEFLRNAIAAEEQVFLIRENYIIEGKIDLIVKENDEYKVIDFKTGNFHKDLTVEKNHRKQLEIYSYLLSKKLGVEIKTGILYYTKNIENPIVEIDINQSSVNKTLMEFDKSIEKIEAKNFEKINSDSKKCEKCEFRHYCL